LRGASWVIKIIVDKIYLLREGGDMPIKKASEGARATFPAFENGISNARTSGKDFAIALCMHICKQIKTFEALPAASRAQGPQSVKLGT
jgi:hypothetical protein